MHTLARSKSLFSVSLVAAALALQACGGSPGEGPGGSSGSGGSGSSSGTTGSGTSSGTTGSGSTSGAQGDAGTPLPVGTSDFVSAYAPGSAQFGGFGGLAGGAPGAANAGTAAPQGAARTDTTSTTTTRDVQETDLYRFDGITNRLYYLNGYRGLMVFDLTQVDHPKLLGRYAIFGTPVQMIVRPNGLAVVVVADWYGTKSDGTPFHGSIVQGLDASNPASIKLVGQAPLGGWVRDTRVVGDVLYAVSEDYGWTYGWGGVYYGGGVVGVGGTTTNGPSVEVSSVSFSGPGGAPAATPSSALIQQQSSLTRPGYNGVFNVTPVCSVTTTGTGPTATRTVTGCSILLAHQAPSPTNTYPAPAKTELEFLDISDPAGMVVSRSTITVDGNIMGWGADNGRWNLDFADGRFAHVVGMGSSSAQNILATVDFANPSAPVLASELAIANAGWGPVARFDGLRMYLAPQGYYTPVNNMTPLEVFDLSVPTAPKLVGETGIPGSVWLMIPSGNQLFALGNDNTQNSTQISLKYLDVTNPANPVSIQGSPANFGSGWAWTPAASTFKAFTHDPNQGLVVLPFSGWDMYAGKYLNGVQLIDYTTASIATEGAAFSKGWVERGIFANGRIVSLSDLALSVVNYINPSSPSQPGNPGRLVPTVTAELTLARNVIASQPAGATIAEISSDWWGNDQSYSEVRALPISDAAENFDESTAPDAIVPGVDARVFTNGSLTYVVTSVQMPYICNQPGAVYGRSPGPGLPSTCYAWQEQVQVVDVSNGGAVKRGTIALPIDPGGWYWYWGWGGFYYYDWYNGGEIAQVGGDALAFRRYHPNYGPQGQYQPASSDLFIVDLSNPDAPSVASVVVTQDWNGWWGDLTVVNNTLYTSHYEWPWGYAQDQKVRYYLDQIDLSDRKNPVIRAKINVPGVLVGGSRTDPTILYTIDYRWGVSENDFDVIKLQGGKAYLQSSVPLDGWVGRVLLSDDGNTAYTTTERYAYVSGQPSMELHQIGLTNPMHPVDSVASGPKGWGWLLGVNGDRMLVQTGWGDGNGLDVYKLAPGVAPAYDQFVRTQGWSISSIARQTTVTSDQLFLSSGDWGVQVVNLK